MPVPPRSTTADAHWSARVAGILSAAPARAGRSRVLAVEGRSGSGKSLLASLLADRIGCPVVHMDDLYPGWTGLAAAVPLALDHVVAPLARGRDPRWPRFDWERGRHAGWAGTAARDTLILEGCGSGARDLRPYLSALIWVDAPAQVRARRLAHRADAAAYAPYRRMWARQEDAFYAAHEPHAHADLVLDNARDHPDPHASPDSPAVPEAGPPPR
ncbi:hypothetical protein ACFO4E_23150 [Nocardiopsis mangrovi]|uniref:Uridine kinase n=1 Tax=Nocardiopsis mangrovi TaxID=1179818 RepID=A0ABV9E1A6_9ACTN